jgi:hypothetical protein
VAELRHRNFARADFQQLKERLARSSGQNQMAAWQAGGLPLGNSWLRNRPSGSNSSGTNRSGNRPSNASRWPSSHSDSARARRWRPYQYHGRRGANQTPRGPNRVERSETHRLPDRTLQRAEDVRRPPELKSEPGNERRGSGVAPKLHLPTPANSSPTSAETPAIGTTQ